jgi:probable H4MPT-linked C1 transfer pathway protein
VQNVTRSYPIRVWSTDGTFLTVEEARRDYLKVAAANWHALAMYAGRYVPRGSGLLIDIGSTTTDLIPIRDGTPHPAGTTDPERLGQYQLVYTGVRRSPVCTLIGPREVAAELFASTLDAYLLLGHIAEDPNDCETCDGRPATKPHAHARMSRMLCGDPEMVPEAETLSLAERVYDRQRDVIRSSFLLQLVRLSSLRPEATDRRRVAILSGSGEFLAQRLLAEFDDFDYFSEVLSLTDHLGPAVAACAPAYALAVLATERQP